MHFIVTTGVHKPDPETRKIIRSQVMRGKNRSKAGHAKQQKVTKHATVLESKQTLRVPLHSIITAYSAAIPTRVGSDLSFTEFPDEIEPGLLMNTLKASCLAMKILFPLATFIQFDRIDTAWITTLRMDAAYLHISLFTIGSMIDILRGPQNHAANQEVVVHLLKGVQLLRERLSLDDEEAKISDPTIRTVLSLTTSAHMLGDHEMAKHHMDGVSKMVHLRGGLAAFRGSKLLIEIFRCDIGLSMSSGSTPVFFNDSFSEPFIPYPDDTLLTVPQRKGNACPQYNMEAFLLSIDDTLATAWRVMRKFCLLLNLAIDTRRILPAHIIRTTMTSVMYRLLHASFQNNSVNEVVRLSLLGVCHNIFLQWQEMRPSYLHFAPTYRKYIFDPNIIAGLPPQIMLWLLIMGGISISNITTDRQLKEHLRHYIRMHDVNSWNEMRDLLKCFIWINVLHDKKGKETFDSVRAML